MNKQASLSVSPLRARRVFPFALAMSLVLPACSGDDANSEDGAGAPDAQTGAIDADLVPVDAEPEADADLSDHAFVTIDGSELVFDEVFTYQNDNGINDVTITAEIGPDCPFGGQCTTLYVSVPGDASLGNKNCSELEVSAQLNVGSERYFSFGSGSAGCSFTLEAFGTSAGEQVAIRGLNAVLEVNLNPAERVLLSSGEMRATMQ